MRTETIKKLSDDLTRWIESDLLDKEEDKRLMMSLCCHLRMTDVDLSVLGSKIEKLSRAEDVYNIGIEDLNVGRRVKNVLRTIKVSVWCRTKNERL